MYTDGHLALAFFVGLIIGVVSTLIFSRRDLTIETIVSLLILTVWMAMHGYGFLFDVQVPALMDFAGLGAAGNFIGISLKDLKGAGVKRLLK